MKELIIKASNNEIDALEDIILVELSDEEFSKKQKLAIRLWKRLAKAFEE